MYGITTITTKGQVTIPEPARRALEAQPGDKVIFDSVDSKTKKGTYKVISSKSVVDELYGSLKGHTKIPYVPIHVARQKAGELLGKYLEEKLKNINE